MPPNLWIDQVSPLTTEGVTGSSVVETSDKMIRGKRTNEIGEKE